MKLKLLHPAINPLKTVQRMELIRRRGRWEMLSEANLLSGEPEFFKELILDWKWNSTEFWKNLGEDFSDLSFDWLEDKIKEKLWINDITVFSSWGDMVTWEKESDGERWTKVLRSHFPDKKLLKELFSSL
jgi:hypothetical protein